MRLLSKQETTEVLKKSTVRSLGCGFKTAFEALKSYSLGCGETLADYVDSIPAIEYGQMLKIECDLFLNHDDDGYYEIIAI